MAQRHWTVDWKAEKPKEMAGAQESACDEIFVDGNRSFHKGRGDAKGGYHAQRSVANVFV